MFWTEYLDHNELVPPGTNPWRGHKITGESRSNKRPYRPDEIMAIINGPEIAARGDVRYSKRTILELYALMFYTGARKGEIANRLLGDVEKSGRGYILHIRASKTAAGARSIPIYHPIPVAVLKRRIAKRTERDAQLFEEFIPGGPQDSLMWYVGKAMGRYRDKVGLGAEVDTHSTRRQLITALVAKGHSKELVQFYVGTRFRA